MIFPHSEKCRSRGAADSWQLKKSRISRPLDGSVANQESADVVFDWLRRIESILRNGLPTGNKAEASTIAHAHSEVEKALEDIFPDWWQQ